MIRRLFRRFTRAIVTTALADPVAEPLRLTEDEGGAT